MKLPKRQITLIRRITQIVCFILILYGLALGIPKIKSFWLPALGATPPTATAFKGAFSSPPYPQVFDAYMPILSCRFARLTGMWRGCFYHFLQEYPVYRNSLSELLPFILLYLIFAVIFGRFLCGWVCPFGFMEDILSMVRKYLGLSYIRISESIKALLKKTSYSVLILGLGIMVMIGFPCLLPLRIRRGFYLVGCQTCPGRFICPLITGFPLTFNFESPIMVVLFAIGLLFLIIFLLSFMVKRLWCRICPSGLMLSFFNRGSLLTLEKDVSKCTHCGSCMTGCPMQSTHVYEENKQKVMNRAECISCYRCVDMCPEDKCLQVKIPGLWIFRSGQK
ncbi:MAG: 4Fe-4S binding protein [Planctomycetota bacterium]